MQKSPIVVRVNGCGSVRDGTPSEDANVEARCELCGTIDDAVASVGADGSGPFACKSCLRERLEAMTVGLWMFREPASTGLPWGKISG
jgi:hypothetical protein